MIPSFVAEPDLDITGTSLQGHITTTRRLLEERFGAPQLDSPDGCDPTTGEPIDSTTAWTLVFGGGVVATIYDIGIVDEETNEVVCPGLDDPYEWHIGGHSAEAARLVLASIEQHSHDSTTAPEEA